MEAYLQPSDMPLSDSISTLHLGPPLIASDLSSDHGDSSALNENIEMDHSPVDCPIIQAWVDPDWYWIQEPSKTDEIASHSARPVELLQVPSFESLPDLELVIQSSINNIGSESELAWSSGGSTLVEDDPKMSMKMSSGDPGGHYILGIRLVTVNGR
ncbi:unnamed protein product [Clonostachys chloroleuca]|uniref:Uncharacterized protein n=1 Tax=Clonostachys chloroleuca TaxID=1926264 RepID=A0AA35PXK0_9HYPO|nr:unnamed protein product [Clonostachys chloroleuca]